MKTYTMNRICGYEESFDFYSFTACKTFAQRVHGQYEVVNNRTGKKCVIVSNTQTFKVYKWK